MRARVETEKDATPRAADDAAARRPTPTTALRVGAACRARASFDEEMRAGEIVDAREEAGGRNCRFLQGPATEFEALHVIRTTLAAAEDCHVRITNYRKNGESFENLVRALRTSKRNK